MQGCSWQQQTVSNYFLLGVSFLEMSMSTMGFLTLVRLRHQSGYNPIQGLLNMPNFLFFFLGKKNKSSIGNVS